MSKFPQNKLQQIAQEMVKAAGYTVEFGEYEFVSTATRLIEPLIHKWYEGTGYTPPTTKTISCWLYKKQVPEWVVIFLIKEMENAKNFSPKYSKLQNYSK
ncbi:hypothetical protein [Nostoc sp. PCC 7107]|uniref:hypothetical protein n=1 Tax=Nostoc sp. PCC 7107 TaxID=317936 RepID=UPI00029F316E|nr:hypothetical protein [Nostoc sp. PCC 7107]AFY45746.1 hypothetical protein Nos7107_5248 [Nostoc sp. PCC 7107]